MGNFLLLLPAVLTLLFVVALPLVFTLWTSLTPCKLTRPATPNDFIGLTNCVGLLSDADFWMRFGPTVLFLTVALNLEFAVGLCIARLINQIILGAAGAADNHGVSDDVLAHPCRPPVQVHLQRQHRHSEQRAAIPGDYRSGDPLAGGRAAGDVLDRSRRGVDEPSVFAILLLAGLFAMPRDPVDAARVDGCNPWQVFCHITLPFLMPFAFIAMTIRSLDVARASEIVKVMTGGGPAERTELQQKQVARTGYETAQMGKANAMADISTLLSTAFIDSSYRKLKAARRFLGACNEACMRGRLVDRYLPD